MVNVKGNKVATKALGELISVLRSTTKEESFVFIVQYNKKKRQGGKNTVLSEMFPFGNATEINFRDVVFRDC